MADMKKKTGGAALLHRIFGKHANPDKEDQESQDERIAEQDFLPPDLQELVFPCPYLKPLEHKLTPRCEMMTYVNGKPIKVNKSNKHLPQIGYRNETSNMLSAELGTNFQNSEGGIGAQIDQQIEQIARASGADLQSVGHWRYYLQCYSKGKFNTTNPPDPVPYNESFKYLPTIFPSNEADRSSSSREFDHVWPRWSEQKTSALMQSAITRFGAFYGSLSTFDESHEMFKAENGYGMSRVERSFSLAAQALFTNEVFVILDTKKDWRFKNNPLVIGKPKIRFYAAAPLLNVDGQAVAVFAVFSQEPRGGFTPFEKHELLEFSHLLMQDLTQQSKWLSDPDLRLTPLLQRDSLIYGYNHHHSHDYCPEEWDADATELQYDLFPPPLNFHKVKTPPTAPQPFDQPPEPEALSKHPEDTPPLSAGSGSCDSDLGPGELTDIDNKPLEQLPLDNMITLDSNNWHSPPPRPWSSSDITSLNINPPNTPVSSLMIEQKLQPFEFTVEDFMTLSDDDCHEEHCGEEAHKGPTDTCTNLSSHEAGDITSNIGMRDVERPLEYSTTHDQVLVPNAEHDLRLKSEESNEDSPSKSGDMKLYIKPIPQQPKASTSSTSRLACAPYDPMAEAAFHCATVAQNLRYDLIYAVELVPRQPSMTNAELLKPGGLEMRLLVAHGLQRPLKLDPRLHIHTLRSRGCQFWEIHPSAYSKTEYRDGRLLPIHAEEGPLKTRTGGILLGAFRKQSLSGNPSHCEFNDLRQLEETALFLRVVLLQAKRRASESTTD